MGTTAALDAWRIIASTTTFLLALAFFGDGANAIKKATGVAVAETIVKMILYYYHERVWFCVKFGQKNESENIHLGGLKSFKNLYKVCESLKIIWVEEGKTEPLVKY